MTTVRPDSENTRDLIAQCRNGEASFDSLFARHRQALKQMVGLRLNRRTRRRFDESDVVQEAYAEAFRRWDDYLDRAPMPFHLWLRKTALEQLIMLRRSHMGAAKRDMKREVPLPNKSTAKLAVEMLAAGPTASGIANERERAEKVRSAINKLSPADQEILLMRNHESMPYDEIAAVLDIEPATARQRNGRALIRLHKLLVEDGMTESQL